jgi:hypothetical protein
MIIDPRSEKNKNRKNKAQKMTELEKQLSAYYIESDDDDESEDDDLE